MTTRWATLAATAILVCLFCTNISAQTDCSGSDLCIDDKKVSEFEPTLGGRFGRMWQYQYQFSEQPAFIVATVNGSNEIIPNPEAYLQQHELIFQLSELVPNASNLTSIVKGVAGMPENKGRTLWLKGLCPKTSSIGCLASQGNFFERLLAGVSGNGSMAERDEVQQGVLTSQSFSLHYGPAGEIDFDPTSLYITGSSWKNALDAVKGVKLQSAFFGASNSDEARCFMKDPSVQPMLVADCVEKFAPPRLGAGMQRTFWTNFASAIIPKFQFKVTDQYDFIKNGGVLVPIPGLQRSLKSYTFTWDFRHIIPSTADRVAVLNAYQSYTPPPPEDTGRQSKLCITISGAARGYVPVGDSFKPERCRSLARDAGAEMFILACTFANGFDAGDPNPLDATQAINFPKTNKCYWQL